MGSGFGKGFSEAIVVVVVVICIFAAFAGFMVSYFSTDKNEMIVEELAPYCEKQIAEAIKTERTVNCDLSVSVTFIDGKPTIYQVDQ